MAHRNGIVRLQVVISTEENIKERIMDMKARCFPTLAASRGGYHTSDIDSHGSNSNTPSKVPPLKQPVDLLKGVLARTSSPPTAPSADAFRQCQLCQQSVVTTALDEHVRAMHLNAEYTCDYCTQR
jgi:hypothetical protein